MYLMEVGDGKWSVDENIDVPQEIDILCLSLCLCLSQSLSLCIVYIILYAYFSTLLYIEIKKRNTRMYYVHVSVDKIFQELREADEEEGNDDVLTLEAQELEQRRALEKASKRWKEYVGALPPQLRPQAPFIPRPKLPRALRQKVIEKLLGQHLAILGVRNYGRDDPEEAVSDQKIVSEASEQAISQELELYQRCSSAQIYSNLAAQTSAMQWEEILRKKRYKRKLDEEATARAVSNNKGEKQHRKIENEKNVKQRKVDNVGTDDKKSTNSNKTSSKIACIEEEDLFDHLQGAQSKVPREEEEAIILRIRRQVVRLMDDISNCEALIPEERQLLVETCIERKRHSIHKSNGADIVLDRDDEMKPLISEIADDILKYR